MSGITCRCLSRENWRSPSARRNPWQPLRAFFIEKGTPHGFRSVGDTPAAVLEIFVKDGVSAAKIQALGVTPGALAKP